MKSVVSFNQARDKSNKAVAGCKWAVSHEWPLMYVKQILPLSIITNRRIFKAPTIQSGTKPGLD